jgi:hypothetical protein
MEQQPVHLNVRLGNTRAVLRVRLATQTALLVHHRLQHALSVGCRAALNPSFTQTANVIRPAPQAHMLLVPTELTYALHARLAAFPAP